MIEQFVNFVIRPPRLEYNPDQYLWGAEFHIAGRKYKRLDLELTNSRGYTLKCSHYVPTYIPENTSLPCVVYCHGNSGCRADANEAAVILLPSNITVFTLDFSGSGLSGGDYVSLGWHEKEDLKCAVTRLRANKQISCIGLWGRSMGAVTSLLYGAEDPLITAMVLDSAFTNLYDLMMELVDVYRIRVPKFTVKMALRYMRRVIQKRAKFDIMDLNVLKFAPKMFIPALFGHASNDIFIQPHHSDHIHQAYGGDKNIITFEGDHNSPRPKSYYDAVSIFFYSTLHPPQLPTTHSSKQHMRAFKVEPITNEFIGSSPAAPSIPNARETVVELLTKSINQMSITKEAQLDFLLYETQNLFEMDVDNAASHLQDKVSRHNEKSCSYTSSNRESLCRCSSFRAARDGSLSAHSEDKQENMTVKALATPVRQKPSKPVQKKKENKIQALWKKLKREKGEKEDSLSQRVKVWPSRHKKTKSSEVVRLHDPIKPA